MPDQPIGPILDGLGITIRLDDGELVETALVLTKTVDTDGQVAVTLATSDGMSWLDQLGLITAAQQVIDGTPWHHHDD